MSERVFTDFGCGPWLTLLSSRLRGKYTGGWQGTHYWRQGIMKSWEPMQESRLDCLFMATFQARKSITCDGSSTWVRYYGLPQSYRMYSNTRMCCNSDFLWSTSSCPVSGCCGGEQCCTSLVWVYCVVVGIVPPETNAQGAKRTVCQLYYSVV